MICQVITHNLHTSLGQLTRLVQHRWNILLIAELHRNSGAKFITLVNRLDVSRGSLSVSLADLIELGFVCKNTGYGHPLRPEYLLTQKGAAIGAACLALVRVVQRREEADLAFRKWTLPLVAAIGERRLRFNQLRASIPGATPRAITIGLKSLLRQEWAKRTLIDDFPPTAGYALRPKGRRILTCLHGLCGTDAYPTVIASAARQSH